MITIRIGESQRSYEEATPDWVTQQVRRRRDDGIPICVQVRVACPGIDLRLSTAECGGRGGVGRRPNREEQRIFELWRKHGLMDGNFTGGNLVAFLKQLENKLGVC